MANVTINPSNLDWSNKLLFEDFQLFRAQCRWNFVGPLPNANNQVKINSMLIQLGRQGEDVVQNNHQPNDADTVDTYFNLFVTHIRPIS